MAKFITNYTTIKINEEEVPVVNIDEFNNFTVDILGLGKIDAASAPVNTLSVMFDLEGFTNFCKQIDPQLAVPEYLSEFLNWIFSEVKKQLTQKEHSEGIETWADLPFLSKFLGDGILFLWDAGVLNEVEIANVVVSMLDICNNYVLDFLPKISKSIVSPPPKLRCGIARGVAYTVGNGNDYVGPCINMSARLQKLHSLSFCCSRRGINPNDMGPTYQALFVVKKVDIRGIGDNELVCILKSEFDELPEGEKQKFKD